MDRLALVLVPGLLCDAQLWRSQIESLADIADMWVPDHMATMERPAQVNEALRRWLRD